METCKGPKLWDLSTRTHKGKKEGRASSTTMLIVSLVSSYRSPITFPRLTVPPNSRIKPSGPADKRISTTRDHITYNCFQRRADSQCACSRFQCSIRQPPFRHCSSPRAPYIRCGYYNRPSGTLRAAEARCHDSIWNRRGQYWIAWA